MSEKTLAALIAELGNLHVDEAAAAPLSREEEEEQAIAHLERLARECGQEPCPEAARLKVWRMGDD